MLRRGFGPAAPFTNGLPLARLLVPHGAPKWIAKGLCLMLIKEFPKQSLPLRRRQVKLQKRYLGITMMMIKAVHLKAFLA